jgi:hypothetical protein
MTLLLGIIFFAIVLLGFTAFTGAPYLPSLRRDLEGVFTKLYPLTSKDVVVDLGSGDGVVLRMARKYGAAAVGYEIGPVYYFVSKLLARGDTKQSIHLQSYWRATFPKNTTVVFAFSDSRDIKKVYALVGRQAAKIGRPLMFITHGFEVAGQKAADSHGAYYLYRVDPLQQA